MRFVLFFFGGGGLKVSERNSVGIHYEREIIPCSYQTEEVASEGSFTALTNIVGIQCINSYVWENFSSIMSDRVNVINSVVSIYLLLISRLYNKSF